MNKKIAFLLAWLLVCISTVSAETKFVKYKDYLIPIQTDTCGIDISKKHVFYIDDVDDARSKPADSNGVQELPILIGWDKLGKYKLVGIGAAGLPDFSFNPAFAQDFVNRAGSSLSVKSGSDLEDEIITQALLFKGCVGQKLQIAIGGPWHIVSSTITTAQNQGTPIADLIQVVGIGGSNISGSRVTPVNQISAAIGSENVKTITQTQFRLFHDPGNSFVGNKNSWYQGSFYATNSGLRIQTVRHDEINIRLNYCHYGSNRNHAMRFCNNEIDGRFDSSGSEIFPPNSKIPSNERYLFRGADFTALAYIIWGDDTWSMTGSMYTEIANGLAELP